mmetsp:Transcript_8333/g.23282  ORF Transcript_8333/g.23282 Transcript_8333/m.23282 type:complete len:239 (+) Transcript_8333:251-967(+)
MDVPPLLLGETRRESEGDLMLARASGGLVGGVAMSIATAAAAVVMMGSMASAPMLVAAAPLDAIPIATAAVSSTVSSTVARRRCRSSCWVGNDAAPIAKLVQLEQIALGMEQKGNQREEGCVHLHPDPALLRFDTIGTRGTVRSILSMGTTLLLLVLQQFAGSFQAVLLGKRGALEQREHRLERPMERAARSGTDDAVVRIDNGNVVGDMWYPHRFGTLVGGALRFATCTTSNSRFRR